MQKGPDRQLGLLLAGARLGCGVRAAMGGAAFAIAVIYEGLFVHVFLTTQLFAIGLGVVPAAIGLYLVVRAGMRARTLGRIARRPETVELVELAMRWGQPALRVTFPDGATEAFSTGRSDRNLLIDAIRRRGLARTTPVARVVDRG